MIFKKILISAVSLFFVLICTVVLGQASSNSPVCENETLTLFANTTATNYTWSGPNGFSSNLENPTLTATVASAGTYTLEALVGGTIETTTTDVVVHLVPEKPIVDDIEGCAGTTITVSPTNYDDQLNYAWQAPGANEVTGAPFTINTNGGGGGGSYSVIASNNNCQSAPDNFEVTVYQKPGTATVDGITNICLGTDLDLNALNTGGNSVTWIKPDNSEIAGTNLFLSGLREADAGSYGVKLSNPGCEGNVKNFDITVLKPLTGFSIDADTAYCEGDVIDFDVTYSGNLNSATYSWFGPNNFTSSQRRPSVTADANADGVYALFVTPNPNATGAAKCESDPVYLDIQVFNYPQTPVIVTDPTAVGDTIFACEEDLVSVSISNINSWQAEFINPINDTTVAPELIFPNVSLADTGLYSVNLLNGVCRSPKVDFEIKLTELPVVNDYIFPDIICNGDSISIIPVANFDFDYEWISRGNVLSTSDTLIVDSVIRDDIYGELYVNIAFGGCKGPQDTIDLSIIRQIEHLHIAVSGQNNQVACENRPFNIFTSVYDSATYRWEGPNDFFHVEYLGDGPFRRIDSIQSQESGVYTVIVSNACDVDTAYRSVRVIPQPKVTFSGDTGICDYEQTEIIFENISNRTGDSLSYHWRTTGDFTERVIITQPDTYPVRITNKEGCYIDVDVEITLECDPIVYIPTAFSPNGDGINEVFQLYPHNVMDLEFWVFTGAGELIFNTKVADDNWDGFRSPPGTYFYKVRYRGIKDGELTTTEKTGTITLIR